MPYPAPGKQNRKRSGGSVQRAGSKAAWIYQAIWEGGIEYERAIIESPLKVAILVANAMADGCKQITIEPHKPLNAGDQRPE